MKWNRERLILSFQQWERKHGDWPTKKQWEDDATLPSDMPIRVYFGNWTNFVKACGKTPRVPEISIKARLNSARSRKGQKGGNNKGGSHIDRHGYVQVWMPGHPNCRSAGYIHEHRLVMSRLIGRPLKRNENVHHKNGVRNDNRPENLELWVKTQPAGQRVKDLVKFAKEILDEYGSIYKNPELLEERE